MGSDLVGRNEELAAITHLLLRAAAGGSGCCLIEGAIGIGKTALSNAALELAGQRGYLVLKAHPVEAETAYSFAAVADLLRPVLDEVLKGLPAPQKVALETALLIDGGNDRAPDPHAVSMAVLTALELLAKKRPVVVAVDDAQWLDSPSRMTLQFVARRLTARMALLVTERTEGHGEPTIQLEGERLTLRPLSAGALQQFIHERIGVALPRPTLLRLHEASGGHPLYALEIARALRASSHDLAVTDPLPVPGSLRELVARRLAAISPETRRALLAVASSAHPAPELLAPEALREAIAAEVVALDGAQVRFTHPLFGSVLLAEASPAERRAVHRSLADLPADEEEIARHLALAATEPDERVAAQLERAASRARSRGAPSAAAELMERARDLTPEAQRLDRLRRAVDAAEFLVAARSPGAEQLLEAVLPGATGNLRARVLELLGLRRGQGDIRAAPPLLEEALEHVDDPRLELRIRLELCDPILRGTSDRSVAHAQRALQLAEGSGDAGLRAAAAASHAALHGKPIEDFESAARMEEFSRNGVQARLLLAWVHLARGSDAGRVLLNSLLDEALAAGLRAHNSVISMLAYAEGRAGNARRAKELATEFLLYGVAEHNTTAESGGLGIRAYAEACLGELSDARRDADASMRIADAARFAGRSIQTRGVLGFVDLSAGEADRAAEHFRAAVAQLFAADAGAWPPLAHTRLAIPTLLADAVAAFAALGRLAETRPPIDWLERDPTNPWHSALAAHCRGVTAAALREQDRAQTELRDAAERLEPLSLPLDYGRALLALGAAQRRGRRRSDARRSLERALDLFEKIEAPLWAATARRELASIGGRPHAASGLTASERRVAELVASGHTNKEVAAALFISAKTVEGHLANVYAKLGVRSRAELARKGASEEIPAP
jgi:DNA-binding CsgD family transcriptional regulator